MFVGIRDLLSYCLQLGYLLFVDMREAAVCRNLPVLLYPITLD